VHDIIAIASIQLIVNVNVPNPIVLSERLGLPSILLNCLRIVYSILLLMCKGHIMPFDDESVSFQYSKHRTKRVKLRSTKTQDLCNHDTLVGYFYCSLCKIMLYSVDQME
jgi:hypothetical protein